MSAVVACKLEVALLCPLIRAATTTAKVLYTATYIYLQCNLDVSIFVCKK